MAHLIVPDIHERIAKLTTSIEPLFDDVDHVIFLGDWFDTYSKVKHQKEMCDFILKYLTDDRFTFLMGNHDAHYRWTNHQFPCSGYSPTTARIVEKNLRPADWQRFKISTRVGPFLISHAGYHPDVLANRHAEPHACQIADSGGFHQLFGPGRSRGGWLEFGGPTWLDFNWEFEDIPLQPQIVGHTFQPTGPKASPNGESFCIDTGLKHLGYIDNDFNFRIGEIETDGTEGD